MIRSSDSTGIVIYSTLFSLLTLAWLYIPA
jgi:hypothetical protein